MTYSCLKQINKQLFSNEYVHFYADNELYNNISQLGLLKDDRLIDNVVFEHYHYWINGKRERDQYDIEYSKSVSADCNVYNKRLNMTVEDRIKV
jgi:hypothetical protein